VGVNVPDLLGKPILSISEKINIFLTEVIAIFAIIEGYSTYVQVQLYKRTNQIDSARLELKEAYGPILSMINSPKETAKQHIILDERNKSKMDEIISTYSFMFPKEIIDYWNKNIKDLEIKLGTMGRKQLIPNFNFGYNEYHIPIEFVQMMKIEYSKRVERFNKLLSD